MDFGKRMTAKAWAWARVRAFVAPRRSRVVNSGEEEGLRNPGVVVRRGAARELWGGPGEGASLRVSGASFARRSRHNENDPVFDKIRQIHGLIPQIHAFFRQIQDPVRARKKYQLIENKRIMGIKGHRERVFHKAAAFARICAHLLRRHPAGGVRERPAASDANPS